MECERFKRLLKTWYLQVQDEALAPARMVDFMEQHISECPTCIMDPEAKSDMAKIITLVLPQDKLKPASRSKKSEDPEAAAPVDDEERDEMSEGEEDEEGEERDEYADDDDDSDPEEIELNEDELEPDDL